MLRLEHITSIVEFETLREEWDAVLRKSGQYSPFLTHGWFRCCLIGNSDHKRLSILVIRDETRRVVGIVPLRYYEGSVREIPARMLGFVSCPDAPFVDVIIERGMEEEVFVTMLRYLYNERGNTWEMLVMGQWSNDSRNRKIFEELLQRQSRSFFVESVSQTPYIPIQGSWEDFLQSRSVRFRKTRRNIINRFNKLRNVEVICHRQDANGDVLNQILAISEKSWKHGEGIAISSREETKQFFSALTAVAGHEGWLLAWLLRIDGVPVAMEYDLAHERKVYALRADFNEDYKECSPGAYLEYNIIKHCFESGHVEYNSGPGAKAYKLQWTEDLRENCVVNVCNSTLKGRMIWGVQGKVVPFLKRIRDFTEKASLTK